jgi:hypothetical protein
MRTALRRNPNAAMLFDMSKAEVVATSEAPLKFSAPFLMPLGSTIEQLAKAQRGPKGARL